MKLTVVSWNVEDFWPETLAEMVRPLGDPDVLCLQEVRIRASDTAAISTIAIHCWPSVFP